MPRIIKPAVGSFTASNITVDSSGRVITASSGAGAANMEMVLFRQGPTSGTYTSGNNASKFQAYLAAGGGGGGEAEMVRVLKDNKEALEDLVSILDLLQVQQDFHFQLVQVETEDQDLGHLEAQETQVAIQI